MGTFSWGLHRSTARYFIGFLALAMPAFLAGGCLPEERNYNASGGGGAASSSSMASSSGGGEGGTSSSSSSSSSGDPVNPGEVLSAQYFPNASTLLFDLAVDPNGDSLLAGRFSGVIDFGDGALVDVGASDIFLARHARDDKLIFSKSYGSPSSAGVVHGAVGSKGGIFATGDISDTSTMNFGGNVLQGPGVWQVALGAVGSPFIYDNIIPTSGNSYMVPYGLAVTSADASIHVGFFGGALNVNPPLTSAGDTDGYMIKFDPMGGITWARAVGGVGHDNISAVTTDPADNTYIAGYFTDSIMLAFGGAGVTSFGGSDIFIAKYGPAGLPKWIRQIGGPGEEFIFGTLAVAPNGDIVVASRANDVITVESTMLPPNGNSDVFIVRYSTDGNLQWAKRFGDAGNQYVESVAFDADGNILVAGTFDGAIDFGIGPLMAPPGASAAYLAKLDPNGGPLFNRVMGGQMDALRVAADGNSSILLAGTGTNVSFELGMSFLPNGGIFLARLAP